MIGESNEFPSWPPSFIEKTPLTYGIVEYAPPNAVIFRGEDQTVFSLDRITFEPYDAGTRITYDTDVAAVW